MKIRKSFQSALSILVLTIGVSVIPTVAQAASPAVTDPVVQQLISVAQQKLDAENNVLISGDATKLVQPMAQVSGLVSQQANAVAALQVRRNKSLTDHGQKYTKAVSTLTVEKTDIQADQATVIAEEESTLTLVDKYSPNPIYTKEEKEHVFHYVLQGNQWSLVSDDVASPFVPVSPESDAVKATGKPISLDVTAKHTVQRSKFASVLGSNIAMAAMSGTYNPTNAVSYALNYWNNYNTAYRSYGNDCTNFVSQASNWGGWQHIGGFYLDNHYWWYSPNPILAWGNKTEARSWVNVQDYYFFARNAGRAFNAQSILDFIIGDTLQVDYGTPDGILDHNTIVTANNGNGNIFLTYHSTNTRNISIWDFIARTPGANYYGTLYYSQY
jgi:hypothetical protein